MANAVVTNFANLIGGNGSGTPAFPTLHSLATAKVVGLDESALSGGINLGTMIAADELYDTTANIFGDTTGDSVICIGTLTSVTFTGGALDAANEVLSSVSGNPIDSYMVLNSVTDDATSPLMIYYDTGTNIPTTPNGGDITIAWGASGLLKLVP